MASTRRETRSHSSLVRSPDSPPPSAQRKPGSKATPKLLRFAVVTLVVPSLFATVALPAYALTPGDETAVQVATQPVQEVVLEATYAKTVDASGEIPARSVARDAFTATSAAEIERAALAAAYAVYTGPTTSDYLANPPYPNFSLDQVAQVALQYQGVPYRFGGADPSGFDCSGLVMFVYAQFGIALPHGVSSQAARGTPITREAALPGDIVTMSGHNGIYLGNGTFIDAPDVGGFVSVRPIWTDDYYIYRLGI